MDIRMHTGHLWVDFYKAVNLSIIYQPFLKEFESSFKKMSR